MSALCNRGVLAALGAALLFGAGTPAAKLLLGPVSPWLLAGGTLPGTKILIAAGAIGFLGYGVSLALFVGALR